MISSAENKFEITGTGVKTIAVVTMLIDHVAAGLLKYWLSTHAGSQDVSIYYDIYWIMRSIGRMAFPLYCYMLVEGFLHTSNLQKYVLRILGMAVISEVPFDLALRWQLIDIEHNNVMWELALGLVVLLCMHRVLFNMDTIIKSEVLRRGMAVAIMLVGMLIGHVLNLDYSNSGIACIAMMYFLYGYTRQQRLISYATGVLMLALMSGSIEIYAFLMLIPLYFYEGHRGRDSKVLRVFFYTFYPLHLITIYVVRLIFM